MSSVGICVVCKESAGLFCASCHNVQYCGKEHQKEDWPNHKPLCRSYEVKLSPVGDQYVVATRNMKKGNVIIEEIPLVFGPSYLLHRMDICPGCHQGMCMKRCPSCNWPVCDAKCSGLVDPTRHGAECALLTKIKHAVIGPSSEVILPLRCLLLQKTDPNKWKVFLKMAAGAVPLHTSNASNESMYVLQESLLKPLSKIAPGMLPDCSEETVRKVYAVLSVHGLRIDGSLGEILYVVCPVASVMQHSCLPNTHRSLKSYSPNGGPSQTRVVMRATENISKGDNITTVYTDTFMSTHLRQCSLWHSRKLFCDCARCLDPRELGTDFGTLRCTKAGCSGWVLAVIQPENSPAADHWKCEKCGKTYSFADIEELNEKMRNEIDACRMSPTEDFKTEEATLVRLEKFLHPNHHYCIIMKEMIIDHYGAMLLVLKKRMTNALLQKTAQMCRDVLRIRMDPAILTLDWQYATISRISSMVDTEIARRNKASR